MHNCYVIKICNILTSTKNASLIITDFLAMIYKNEQPRTASLCRGWAMLENDLNLICKWRVIPMTTYKLNVHMTALCIDFNSNLHPVCAVNVLLINEQNLDHFFKQLCLRAITLWNDDVILKGTATLMISMFYQKELYEPWVLIQVSTKSVEKWASYGHLKNSIWPTFSRHFEI